MAFSFPVPAHESGLGQGVDEGFWTVLFEDNLPLIAILTSAARRCSTWTEHVSVRFVQQIYLCN